MKTVGPKYGKLLGKIQGELKSINGNEAYAQLKKTGQLTICDGGVILAEEDLLITISQLEGYQSMKQIMELQLYWI